MVAIAVACSSACRSQASPPTKEAEQLISGFKQGEKGNCSSIGFIKAVLHEYKASRKIFASFDVGADGGIEAKTVAGTVLKVTGDEVTRAGIAADLVLVRDDKATRAQYAEANTLFALMGKACELDCSAGGESCPFGSEAKACTFDNALEYLDTALNFRVPPQLLGLSEGTHWRALKGWVIGRWFRVIKFVKGGHSCVAATKGHTFFIGDGWADKWGHPVRFTSKFGSAFAFKSAAAYCLGGGEAQVEMEEGSADGQPPPAVLNESDFTAVP